MKNKILFSLDLEDHTGRYDTSSRYVANTERYLDYLEQNKILATFFIVGRVAEHAPSLIKKIGNAGHEIACHSYDHTPLPKQSAAKFREHCIRAKTVLEQSSGQRVWGFRAPSFSLTANTPWAPDILKEVGFDYSSSILPAANPIYGFPGLQQTPLIWRCGLIEFPVVLGQLIPKLKVPFLGGFYLRYLPTIVVKRLLMNLPDDVQPWIYLHPYDIDADERNWHVNHAALWVGVLLWFNRRNTLKKLEALTPVIKSQTFNQALHLLSRSSLPFADAGLT